MSFQTKGEEVLMKVLPFSLYALSLILMLQIPFTLGCGSAGPEQSSLNKSPIKLHQSTPVILSPGDVIALNFPYAPQFDQEQSIRPDGKIILPLIGEVQASGTTPKELGQTLSSHFKAHLKHPEVAVIVRSFFQRKVYVAGEVNKPGAMEIMTRLSAMEAIIQAGGFNLEKAQVKNVILIRQEGDKRISRFLDLRPALRGDPYPPSNLQPNDVLIVPRTGIANLNQWIEQHVYNLLPPITIGYEPF